MIVARVLNIYIYIYENTKQYLVSTKNINKKKNINKSTSVETQHKREIITLTLATDVGEVNKATAPFRSQSSRNAFHARPTVSNSLMSSME